MRHHRESGFSAVEMLIVLAIMASLAAIAVPISGNMIEDARLRGDAQGVSSAIALTKMTGATKFTRARIRIDRNAGTFQIETWQTSGTPGWVSESGQQQLSYGGEFSAGPVTTPPPNSQDAVAQPAPCLDNDGAAINGTSCIFFNSRGVPVSSAGLPITTQVLYLRGPSGVFGIVVSATGRIEVWRATVTASGVWWQQ